MKFTILALFLAAGGLRAEMESPEFGTCAVERIRFLTDLTPKTIKAKNCRAAGDTYKKVLHCYELSTGTDRLTLDESLGDLEYFLLSCPLDYLREAGRVP